MLWRVRAREMNIEVPLVVSNHETLRTLVKKESIFARADSIRTLRQVVGSP